MKRFEVIIGIKLKYDVAAKSRHDAMCLVENMELPKEYVENSFEFEKIRAH